jgi:hypothetical protein
MALPEWKQIIFSKKGALNALYDAVKTELANITAGIPEDNSITADKLMAGIVGYSKLDQNTKRFTIQLPINADAAAADTWAKAVYIPSAVTVIDAGIIPDTTFGQATDYADIKLVNKGTDGAGTTEIAAKNFNSTNVATAHDYTDLGTVSNEEVLSGSVLEFIKSKTGDGQIVPASTLVLVLERDE